MSWTRDGSNSPTKREGPRRPQPPDHQNHHGSGQWNGQGYAPPKHNQPPSQIPRPVIQALPHQPLLDDLIYHGAYGSTDKRMPLGPPPSARRGPVSYFPTVTSVHPIAEELESVRGSILGSGHDSMQSYGGRSHVPFGVSGHAPEDLAAAGNSPGRPFQSPDRYDSPTTDRERRYPQYELQPQEQLDGGSGREEDGRQMESPEPAVVRNASLGQRTRPGLITVHAGERTSKSRAADVATRMPALDDQFDSEVTPDGEKVSKSGQNPELLNTTQDGTGQEDVAVPAPAHIRTEPLKHAPSSRFSGIEIPTPNTDFDAQSSVSDQGSERGRSKNLFAPVRPISQRDRSKPRSPLVPAEGPKHVQGDATSDSNSSQDQLPQPGSGLSDQFRGDKKRPSLLNVDAPREADMRGSLTSLTDLIVRATRLASNLDRGRTASRLGMDWFDGASEKRASQRQSAGSISDMLAAFPPPAVASTKNSRTETIRRSVARWSSRNRHSTLDSDSDANAVDPPKPKRRCCGMRLWVFIVLIIVLIALIAAAVVVPVVLVVLPQQSKRENSLDSCQKKTSCRNGGTAALTGGVCRCICVNGYTGSSCDTATSPSCTTVSAGSTGNATVGDDIPAVLSAAQNDFGIALDVQALMNLFSSANLSCDAENALVTFANVARRAVLLDYDAHPPASRYSQNPFYSQVSSTTSSDVVDATTTSNGIVFAVSTSTSTSSTTESAGATTTLSSSSQIFSADSVTASTAPASTSASASATSSAGSASSSTSAISSAGSASSSSSPTSGTTGQRSLDFARVAVLYIFQVSGELEDAVTAQMNFQTFFEGSTTATGQSILATNITLGNGFTCNLPGFGLSLSNGTVLYG